MASIRRTLPYRASLPGALTSSSHELRALDLPVAVYTMSQTAAITPLNLIRTGSTFCNRQGRKVQMISLRLVGQLLSLRTTNVQDYTRILLVYDRQSNGALPAITDILQTTDQAAANSTTAFSGINLNNRDRFVILRDEHLTLPTQTVTAGVISNPGNQIDPISKTFKIDWFVKLKGLLTQFKADSAPSVIGDISTGALLLVTFGDSAAGAESFTFEAETRLRFVDI